MCVILPLPLYAQTLIKYRDPADCAYRTLLVGDRLPSRLTRYISELTTGLLKVSANYCQFKELKSDYVIKSKLKSDIWRQSETSKSPPLTLGKVS